jgi:hypothetical protein
MEDPDRYAAMELAHCGHPTALWPWQLFINGEMVLQPNGTAWQLKAEAMKAGKLILDGLLRTHLHRFERGRMRAAGAGQSQTHIIEAWELIRGNLTR